MNSKGLLLVLMISTFNYVENVNAYTVIQNYPYGPYGYYTDLSTPQPDSVIQKNVRQIIQDNLVTYRYVNSYVFNANVTLSGTVESIQARNQIENAVKGISGVRNVDNRIQVLVPYVPPKVTPEEGPLEPQEESYELHT